MANSVIKVFVRGLFLLTSRERALDQALASLEAYRRLAGSVGRLRGARTEPHPVFGPFDAHQWNRMFSFHLGLHYRQASLVAKVAHAAAG